MSAKAGSRRGFPSAKPPQCCDILQTELTFHLAQMLFAREDDREQLSMQIAERH